MTATALIVLAIKASIALLVFSLGLQATRGDMTYVLRKPVLLLRSLFAMNVVMLALVIAVGLLTDLPHAIKIALLVLAVSPVPPVLPIKQEKAGGSESYAVGLQTAAALLSIALIPISIELVGRIFGYDVHMPARKVAPIVLTSVLLPLAAGVVVHRFAPAFARRITRPVAIIAAVLLALAAVLILIGAWPQMKAAIGNGTLIALALFTGVGLAVGHLLGGPDSDNRTVLALATSARHPAMALTIAATAAPNEKGVLAVVLWHLLVGALVAVPYVLMRKRKHAMAMKPPLP